MLPAGKPPPQPRGRATPAPAPAPLPVPAPTCGQPQREEAPGSGSEMDDAVADVLGGPLAGLRVRLQNDELHGGGRALPGQGGREPS